MDHSAETISSNLRSIRDARNLSLDQLSELTGVSKSMLRQIEIGKSSPTIATIWKIANGLRVSFTALLRKPDVEAEVRAFKGEMPLTAKGKHYRLYPLIHFSNFYYSYIPTSSFAESQPIPSSGFYQYNIDDLLSGNVPNQ